MKFTLAVLCILIQLSSYGQSNEATVSQTLEAKIENVKWIAGHWKGEAFGGKTEEIWSEPSAGTMMGMFKLVENGRVVFYELEIIREVDSTLVLQLKHFGSDLKGWETKNETVDFKLRAITADKVIFEGMTFESINANEMNVYVEMKNKEGQIYVQTFNYKK